MTTTNRAIQARCAALGFPPGPIDGVIGSRTRLAREAAERAQADRKLPFVHPTGLSRLHLHWTAGHNRSSAFDRRHYHVLIEGDGKVIRAHDPTERLEHTRLANTGAIGVSLCAMAGATERPFSPGAAPITPEQLAALAEVCAHLCATYDIPVGPYSVLTHAEVQPTLGIKQRQKWDITWLPGMASAGDPRLVGDRLRDLIGEAAGVDPGQPVPAVATRPDKLARIAAIVAEA